MLTIDTGRKNLSLSNFKHFKFSKNLENESYGEESRERPCRYHKWSVRSKERVRAVANETRQRKSKSKRDDSSSISQFQRTSSNFIESY